MFNLSMLVPDRFGLLPMILAGLLALHPAVLREAPSGGRSPRLPFWPGVVMLAAIAVYFLWNEHRAHLLGVLPWLLLLACPVIHLLMHRGHGHGSAHGVHRLENEKKADQNPVQGDRP